MSPEQARGKSVDKRTDIWAFGCVLFEMLSGTMAFEGDTVSDTIAAILERDPDWSTLPSDTPRAVRRLVQRCLEKDPKQRLHDIGDARLEIEQIIQSPTEDVDADVALHQSRTWRRRTQLAAAAGVVLALSAAVLVWFSLARERTVAGDARVSRLHSRFPEGHGHRADAQFGDRVFAGRDTAGSHAAGRARLSCVGWMVSTAGRLKTASPRSSATLQCSRPTARFSRGSSGTASLAPIGRCSRRRWLVATPVKITDYDHFHTGDWAADGWIYWTSTYPGGIVRVRDSGGAD